MRPTIHFNASIVIVGLINSFGVPFNIISTTIFVVASVVIDLDIFISFFTDVNNHRRLLTHNIILWGAFIPLSYLLQSQILFWLSLGCFLHLLIDLIDFGLPVFPNSRLTPHLIEITDSVMSELDFATLYWQHRLIQVLEITIMIFSVIFIITMDLYLSFVIISVALVSYGYSIQEIIRILT